MDILEDAFHNHKKDFISKRDIAMYLQKKHEVEVNMRDLCRRLYAEKERTMPIRYDALNLVENQTFLDSADPGVSYKYTKDPENKELNNIWWAT